MSQSSILQQDGNLIVRLPIALLKPLVQNPLEDDVWGGRIKPNIDTIKKLVANNAQYPKPFNHTVTYDHNRRIAHFVNFPDPTPIVVEVDQYGSFLIDDGNHRYSAALIREDEFIDVMLGGWTEFFPAVGIGFMEEFECYIAIDPIRECVDID